MTLPVIPTPGTSLVLGDVIAVEERIAHQITTLTDVDELEEMRAKADALAQYLRGKELHGPMLGAQRRIEARIGQLIGEAQNGRPRNGDESLHARKLSVPDRNRFRLLARGFDVLTDEEWRQSRRSLIAYLQEKFPVPRHQPTVVVQKDGIVKKSRRERTSEISQRAAVGYRAAQIADELGITEQQVRNIARAEGITLPDASLAPNRKIDPRRVVENIVTGLEGTVISLRTIGKNLTGVTKDEASTWADSLDTSISSLKRLRSALLEISHGRASTATGTEVGTKGRGAGKDQDSPSRAA